MKSFGFLYFLLLTILLIVASVLYACSPYPACEKSSDCILIGGNQKIILPVLMPITSSNTLLSQEFKKMVDLAINENVWISENIELILVDNFDDQQKNVDAILPFLEAPGVPIIFYFLSPENKTENNDFLHKTGKILVSADSIQINDKRINSFVPDENTLKQQVIAKISQFAYTKEMAVFSDIVTVQNDLVNLCNQNNVNCYQFGSTDSDLINKFNKQVTVPLVLISQKPLILEWLTNNYFLLDNPILIFDTSFSNPEDFTTLYNDIRWIGPDFWFAISSGSKSDSEKPHDWNFMITAQAFRQFNNMFQVLENQLSNSRNGFRQFDPALSIEQFTKISPLQEIEIHYYQLKNNQFIMVNEPALE